MYPVPFADVEDNIRIAQAAERLGYDSVWGNDHVTTQHYVRREFAEAPRYYAPLLVLAAIGAATTRLRLGTALLIAPFRHPVMIAKEAATLDHLTRGRLLLGIGIGAYREEFEAMYGTAVARAVRRGDLVDETLTILVRLWTENEVSFAGKYFTLESVQSAPKPKQQPFPLYVGGNSSQHWRRCARYGRGWLPAGLTVDEVAEGVREIRRLLDAGGRAGDEIDVAPQFPVAIGRTHEDAVRRFRASQLYKHNLSLQASTLKGRAFGPIENRQLVGTPDELGEKLERYVEAGVTTFPALLFAANTIEELMESMQWFAEAVMPRFAGDRP